MKPNPHRRHATVTARVEKENRLTSASSSPLLIARSVHKKFGGLKALEEVDIEVRSGEILGIIGPNGAGKSTLINILAGLYRPDGGRIFMGNVDITKTSVPGRAQLGLVRTFQHTRALTSFTVREALRLASHSPQVHRMKERPDVAAIADEFGLEPYLDRLVPLLPYGTQKVLNIALISCGDPKVLLLDEPFAGVTAEDVSKLSNLALELRKRGIGIVLVEHDMKSLMLLSDRVVVLDGGRTVAEGPPKEIQDNEMVRTIYLGRARRHPEGTSRNDG
jgi:ABC-type branched-subunit amino acid transport system ATPase component